MRNYVAFNAKYYKNSSAAGEIGHVQRVFSENKNQIKEFAGDNFGCGYNIYDLYSAVFKKVEGIKGKKIQKNSNTFIDGVLSFSRDQMLEIMKDPDWKTSLSHCIEQYMEDVKKMTGMEPLGWEMHMDEGHKDPETGEYKMNYHAQCIFFNYDFKRNKAPLRDLMGRKSDSIWSSLQDVAANRFAALGFVRGVSAEDTHSEHLERDAYIEQKQERISEELIALQGTARDLLEAQRNALTKLRFIRDGIDALESQKVYGEQFDDKFNQLSLHVGRVKLYFEQVYNRSKSVRLFLSALKSAMPSRFDYSKNVISSVLAFFGSNKPKLQYKDSLNEMEERLGSFFYDESEIKDISRRLERIKGEDKVSLEKRGTKPKPHL